MKAGVFGAFLLVLASGAQAETWAADPDHTEVRVYWDHAGFSEQSLEFTKVDGSLTFSLNSVPESCQQSCHRGRTVQSGFVGGHVL